MKDKQVHIRMTNEEIKLLRDRADFYHFKNMSEFIRFCALNAEIKVEVVDVTK